MWVAKRYDIIRDVFKILLRLPNPNLLLDLPKNAVLYRLEKGREETGMFLFEIGLLNGFTVIVEEERKKNKGAKMVELDDDSVNVYYDQVKLSDFCTTKLHFRNTYSDSFR